MKNYYSKTWYAGYNVRRAETGQNAVEIHAYSTKLERDNAVDKYLAPNHCPTATMEAVKASDPDVRRAIASGWYCDFKSDQ